MRTSLLMLFTALIGAAGVADAQIVIYDRADFRGRTFTSYDAIRNFQRYGFNDRSGSIVVRSGTWEVCTDADFAGQCVTLVPGRYPTLISMGIKNRVSSLRPVEEPVVTRPVPPAPPPVPVADRARVTLFGQPDFRGRSIVIEQPIARDLARLGFDDRASSIRVERGYWLFCSDADFDGECRTFGPGDYPVLPPELDHRVSSARRISPRYPYHERPAWGG